MPVQHIAFRTDASSQIGTGHFMRCLTLANALKERGVQTRFVSRHLPEYLHSMLVAKGHEFALLDSIQNDAKLEEDSLTHSHWLGVSQASDAQATIQALSDQTWDWLIVDHYALDTRWESALRQTTSKIMVIDDIADRFHDCDLLLDQNLYTDMEIRYMGKVPPKCQLLLGPSYALLRREFRQLHELIKPRTGPANRILVFFGGVDTNNYTGIAINALIGLGVKNLHVDIVIGAQHPCFDQIEEACVQNGFFCYIQTDRMAELMAVADLAIGAGGSASWERCCLGLPALIVSLANNQIEIAKALDLCGACVYVGTAETANKLLLKNAIINSIYNPEWLTAHSAKSYSIVDGLGVERLYKKING